MAFPHYCRSVTGTKNVGTFSIRLGFLFLPHEVNSMPRFTFVHNSFICFEQILAMWGVLRYYNLLRVGVTWKGPEIIELWYNQCDSSKGSVKITATQCYHYYVNGSSDNTNGSDGSEYDDHDNDDGDGDDENKQQHQQSNNAYSTRIHQSANRTNNLNSPSDIHNNNNNSSNNNSNNRYACGQYSTAKKSYMLRSTSKLRRPHRQMVLENFTYNNGYGDGTVTDNDSMSSDVDEKDSLLGASEVNFISLVWHKLIYATQ